MPRRRSLTQLFRGSPASLRWSREPRACHVLASRETTDMSKRLKIIIAAVVVVAAVAAGGLYWFFKDDTRPRRSHSRRRRSR